MHTTNAIIDGQRFYAEAGDIYASLPLTPADWRAPIGHYLPTAWDEYDNETAWATVDGRAVTFDFEVAP